MYDSTLDPISPDFDPYSWGEVTLTAADLDRLNDDPVYVAIRQARTASIAAPIDLDETFETPRRPGLPVPRMTPAMATGNPEPVHHGWSTHHAPLHR